jgi:hypothetical protein
MATEPDEGSTPVRPPRRGRLPSQAVAFVGVLLAGVLIGWVVFHDDGSAPAPASSTAPAVASQARVYPKLGVSLALPKGWKTSFRQSVLTAVSHDESVSVALLFKARELSRQRAKVGTATTIVTELVGRAHNRRPIRILSMGTSSRWRTYSIQAFTVPVPSARRVAELRTLLASVRYRQPR